MQLTAPEGITTSRPHPEGITAAVCVDVIDLGMVRYEYRGEQRVAHKVRIVFESEEKKDDGTRFVLSRSYTASLHPMARLTQTVEKWRGRPVQAKETVDLSKMVGASAMLLVSNVTRPDGSVFSSIDAITKPSKKVMPSGLYDPKAAREKIAVQGGSSHEPRATIREERGPSNEQRAWSPEPEERTEAEVEAHF